MATKSLSKLDLTKPVQTKDGRKVRILCTDAMGSDYSVIALITTHGIETPVTYTRSGKRYLGTDNDTDLVNVPITVRVCFYENNKGNIQSVTLYEGSYWSEEKIKNHYSPNAVWIKDIVLDT